MRGENRSTRGKTAHGRVENQQTQSTYDTGCGNRTQATLVEGKCSHHYANPATSFGYLSHLCSIEFQNCFEMDKQKPGFDKCAERKKLRSVFFLSSSCVIYLLCYLKILSYCGFNSSSIFYSSAANCSVI